MNSFVLCSGTDDWKSEKRQKSSSADAANVHVLFRWNTLEEKWE